ncbi:hypothetical protein [Paenibacillus sp. P32E]|uniref:hypothetical protein n=1 Tax=Paenibacillus sp. P32E TaxID=1349434 RepID=UPI000969B2BA|nr:hypothetical protein [Paenibacillus sp. P32E]OKP90165.1 hypothetical protein A3848_12460 [Paenibacillus sp. P32E]
MASTKLVFSVDEVQRLQTKIGQVSQDTNLLYLQLKGQANNWSGIPLGQNLVQAQVLINELMVEAEKLEDLIRSAVQGVQSVQEENKRQASQLTQPFSLFAGMLGSFGGNGSQGRYSIPTFAQKAATKLISSIAALTGRDELDSDPMVRNLRDILQKSGLGTVEGIAAQSKLNDINEARNLIAKAQTAYEVYEAFGNQTQMDAMHKLAEDARKKLESLGVDKAQYEAGKDLSVYFKQSALKACDYDPSSTTSSVPLLETEEYSLLLQMLRMEGTKGDWAKQQLALMKPQATIGSSDPTKQVSYEEILNRDNPEVMKRLKETYWSTLSTEEQDRIYAETKAYYEKQEKEVADKNRLLRSGVGNQMLANILEGGSNILVNAIDTASYGMAGTITDWTMGPKPAGYVDPTDNPYGKKAGQFLGTVVSIGLPVKYLNAIKTGGAVGRFSPTLLRSMVAGAVSGTVGEAFDAFNDFRDDGKQSLGERIAAVGFNTVIAGAGDLAITAGSKVAASTMRFVRGKLLDIKVEKVEVAGKTKAEIEAKAKEIGETRIEGTPKADLNKIRQTAPDYYKELIDNYGDKGRYFARSPEEYESLAKDPAKNFKINEKSKIERLAGLELEARGDLPGPIVRDTNPAGAEFIDATGVKWDVKGWYSKFAPKGYTLEKAIADIEESLSKGENVIIDSSKMFPEHINEVREAIKELGLSDKLLWWP